MKTKTLMLFKVVLLFAVMIVLYGLADKVAADTPDHEIVVQYGNIYEKIKLKEKTATELNIFCADPFLLIITTEDPDVVNHTIGTGQCVPIHEGQRYLEVLEPPIMPNTIRIYKDGHLYIGYEKIRF